VDVKSLSLVILPQRLAICRLFPDEPIPNFLSLSPFWSITRTSDELSVVLSEDIVPADWKAETGWRCLKVIGPLDFDLTGCLASLAMPLCEAGVSIFVISTYDTDYLLIREESLEKATQILLKSGHSVT
jgi:uncharacterized protein